MIAVAEDWERGYSAPWLNCLDMYPKPAVILSFRSLSHLKPETSPVEDVTTDVLTAGNSLEVQADLTIVEEC